LPPDPIILDCDPGHDDAVALLLALASPEVELVGVTTVSGNQTLDKTTANALRVLEFVDRTDVPVAAGADRPLVRERHVAAHVHGESGLDGPDLPPAQGAPIDRHAIDFIAGEIRARDGALTLVPTGPLTNVALLLAVHPDARPRRIVLMGGAIGEGNVTPAAEFNIWADPEAARRVFESGLDVTMIGLDVTPPGGHPSGALGASAQLGARRGDGRRARRLLRQVPRAQLPGARRLAHARPRRARPRHNTRAGRGGGVRGDD
jgi:inosine-uridine nucleoside N-ribohydrolase